MASPAGFTALASLDDDVDELLVLRVWSDFSRAGA